MFFTMFCRRKQVFNSKIYECKRAMTNSEKSQMVHIFWESIFKKPFIPVKEANASNFCQNYRCLPVTEKYAILRHIATKYGLDGFAARKAAMSFIDVKDTQPEVVIKAVENLKYAFLPQYMEALSTISKLNSGIKFLVDLRVDTLNMLKEINPKDVDIALLKDFNNKLKDVLAFCFNVGFLSLERITWKSSCQMLQKISEYEAVHPMRNWTDLKQRVGPYRRCFVFTHSSMPYEPIVMLHTALTDDISSSISSIVKRDSEIQISGSDINIEDLEERTKINAAVFYSVTSTQKGLSGIELGNMLIKTVVGELLKEFPHISKFSSLSPIPGFREWLLMEIKKVKQGESVLSTIFTNQKLLLLFKSNNNQAWNQLELLIASNRWINDPKLTEELKYPLLKTCAHYLYNEKRRLCALNSVAHFHLRNGAELWRLNWAADLSPRGLDNSCGIMVNYRYFMDETENNSEKYLHYNCIKISSHVKDLL